LQSVSEGPKIRELPTCVISGFRRGVDEICAVLGFYAAWNPKRELISISYLYFRDSRRVSLHKTCRYRSTRCDLLN